MTWQDRSYYTGPEYGYDQGPRGLRSWFGGLPAPTKAVKWIALANIAMFVLCQVTGQERSPLYQMLAMQTPKVLGGQLWRLVTFTYLHDQAGLAHIFFNMLGLYFLGLPLEQAWGAKRFFIFYTLGGAAAVVLYLIATILGFLPPTAILVGASAGVLAVLGACAVLFPHIRIIMILFPVPIRMAALILFLLYAFNLLNRGENAGGDACHLAGLAFGIAWGYRGDSWTSSWRRWRKKLEQGRWEAKQEQRLVREEEVDRILEKVHREGVNSLTRSEKKTLADATRQRQETGPK